MFVCPFGCLSICLFVRLVVCPFVSWFICSLFICLYVWLSVCSFVRKLVCPFVAALDIYGEEFFPISRSRSFKKIMAQNKKGSQLNFQMGINCP